MILAIFAERRIISEMRKATAETRICSGVRATRHRPSSTPLCPSKSMISRRDVGFVCLHRNRDQIGAKSRAESDRARSPGAKRARGIRCHHLEQFARGEIDGSVSRNWRISAKRLRSSLLARLSVPRQILNPRSLQLLRTRTARAENTRDCAGNARCETSARLSRSKSSGVEFIQVRDDPALVEHLAIAAFEQRRHAVRSPSSAARCSRRNPTAVRVHRSNIAISSCRFRQMRRQKKIISLRNVSQSRIQVRRRRVRRMRRQARFRQPIACAATSRSISSASLRRYRARTSINSANHHVRIGGCMPREQLRKRRQIRDRSRPEAPRFREPVVDRRDIIVRRKLRFRAR